MCGIAGFFDPQLNNDEARSSMHKMLESILHRGPDNRSIFQQDGVTLGHNRLTIIDLSDSANQPMIRNELVLVFNGEIYNYIELKNELIKKGHVFTTNSDSEVIMASYEEWGSECPKKFVGMWSFVIWSRKDQSLFCSRDRFGIKPFLYIHEGNRFYFASEYKPLKFSPLFTNELNERHIKRGLQMGWVVYHDETYFQKIKALPESCNLFFKDGKIHTEKYWDITLNTRATGPFENKRQNFLSLFTDSIKLHMRSDVEVGACLSGGIDSSSITSVVGKLFPEVDFKTFTIYYKGEEAVDERPWVNQLIEKYPHIKNFSHSPEKEELGSCFHRMCYHLDTPTNWSSDISQYYVMELASKHKMKVLLDGQGSDEYLAGYMHSFYRLIGNAISNFRMGEAWKLFREHSTHQEFSAGKSGDVLFKSLLSSLFSEQQLYEFEYKYFHPWISKNKNRTAPFNLEKKSDNKLDNFLYHLLFTTLLPSLLHFEDRNSMAFSIESRVPFLDHRLVEYGFKLNNDDKINKGVTKHILRESMRGILPDSILNRRDKKGFTTPGAKWLRGDIRFLLEQDFSKLDMIDHGKVQQLIKQFKQGDDKPAHLLWRIGGLNYWVNNFV